MHEAERYLGRYISAQRTIAALCAERERIRDIATRITGGDCLPRDRVGGAAARIADIDLQINGEIARAEEVRREISAAIDAVQDSRMRDVLRLRYIAGMGWQRVAEILHYSERWVRELHSRSLQYLNI